MNPRRKGSGFGGRKPDDPERHGATLRDALDGTLAKLVEPGFDPRRLLKRTVDNLDPEDLRAIDGLDVVSQEDKTVVVLFATEQGQREFRNRLDLLSRGEKPTRKEVLFAITGVSDWGPEDRIGGAIRREGLPAESPFVVDVELWPLELGGRDRKRMLSAFSDWCNDNEVAVLDTLDQRPSCSAASEWTATDTSASYTTVTCERSTCRRGSSCK